MHFPNRLLAIALLSAAFGSALGCGVTTRATEGSTESIENTTEASADLSIASTELTSSTSPRAEEEHEHKLDAEEEARREAARLFAEQNLKKLHRDLAAGGGEYLSTVAVLLDVAEHSQNAFAKEARREFPSLQGLSAEQLIQVLGKIADTISA